MLRISEPLYKELEAWAEQEMRSVNGQIEFILRAAVEKRRGKPLKDPPPAKEEQ
jgi:hypothetical protein